ncbi:MAG TPA: ATP-binding protein [Vicinamibacterales bacterium]|nr:ATP-binding protein [Vicinamibacterales bacterium]
MTEQQLVDRLAAHRTLGAAPRDQLEWIVRHGELHRFAADQIVVAANHPLQYMWIILSGRMSIRVDRGAGPRKVMEWGAGDVSGMLPYSRARTTPGDSRADEPLDILAVHRDHFPAMIRECHEITAALVHTMIDRARHFTSTDLHDEKMISLGRLSAGLAHELNNPASALARGAKALADSLVEMEAAALALGAVRLSGEQRHIVDGVRDRCLAERTKTVRGPLEQADREDEFTAWLDRHGADAATGESLAESAVSLDSLDRLPAVLDRPALDATLRWLAAGCATRALVTQIESAAIRIHTIVAAVKGFTYMDEAVPMPVDIGLGLSDTLTMVQNKAKRKSASISLDVEPGMPKIQGYGGELNQVWLNLVDNALDAIPDDGGRVEISASRQDSTVLVRVVDNGPGIPEETREKIFDPFFTTKPQGQGTGLGLDITRRLVRKHDGVIEVQSRPGRTEFRVMLPIGPEASHPRKGDAARP